MRIAQFISIFADGNLIFFTVMSNNTSTFSNLHVQVYEVHNTLLVGVTLFNHIGCY